MQVLPRDTGSFIYIYMLFYDSASLPPLLTSGFTVLQKSLIDDFFFPKFYMYMPLKNLKLKYIL